MPINVNSMFVHRMEDVPGPASLAGLVVKPACGDHATGNQVEGLALWPNAQVFHCPRNERGAKREIDSYPPTIPAATGRKVPFAPLSLQHPVLFPKFLLYQPVPPKYLLDPLGPRNESDDNKARLTPAAPGPPRSWTRKEQQCVVLNPRQAECGLGCGHSDSAPIRRQGAEQASRGWGPCKWQGQQGE